MNTTTIATPNAVALAEYRLDGDDLPSMSEWASTVTAEGATDNEPDIGLLDELEEDNDADKERPRNDPANWSSQPALHQALCCPFQIKNPERFNLRDHPKCSNGFEDLSKLKRHVLKNHKREDADHMRFATHPQRSGEPFDPEDGITSATAARLRKRKNDSKINTWAGLWQLLFPNSTEVPRAAYEPRVPMDPVEATKVHETSLSLMQNGGATLEPATDILTRGGVEKGPATTFALQILTLRDSESRISHAECLKAFQAGITRSRPTKPKRGKPTEGDHDPEALGVISRPSGHDGREQQNQRQRPVLPRASALAGGSARNSFAAIPATAYPDPSFSASLRHPPPGPQVSQPATGIRNQQWAALPAQATLETKSAPHPTPAHPFVPSEIETSFSSPWSAHNPAQHVSNTLNMHHGHGQSQIAGSYETLHTGPAGSYDLRQGHYPSGQVNPRTHQQGSVPYTPHSGEHYGRSDFSVWPEIGDENTG